MARLVFEAALAQRFQEPSRDGVPQKFVVVVVAYVEFTGCSAGVQPERILVGRLVEL